MTISIRSRTLLACLGLTAVTAIAGVVTLAGEKALRGATTKMYDDSFMSIDYFRAAETQFAKLNTLASQDGSLDKAEADKISQAVIDNLDVAVERATSAAAKAQTVDLRSLVVKILAEPYDRDLTLQQTKAGTFLFERGSEQFAQDGFMFRLEAERIASSSEYASEVAIGASIGAGLLILLALSQSISRPYRQATRMAAGMAGSLDGDRIVNDPRVLMNALEVMKGTLTMREEVLADLSHALRHDPLTGLLNRTSFLKVLDVASPDENLNEGGLVLLNIVDFRGVNLRVGQKGGDMILQGIASSLLRFGQARDIVARTGGDEFAVFRPSASPGSLSSLAVDLKSRVGEELTVGLETLRLQWTVGVAIRREGEAMDDLYSTAEADLTNARSVAGRTQLDSPKGHEALSASRAIG